MKTEFSEIARWWKELLPKMARRTANLNSSFLECFVRLTILFLFIFVFRFANGQADCPCHHQTEAEKAFGQIYEKGIWGKDQNGKGTSGSGSTLEEGRPFIDYVQEFINRAPNIRSVVDVGCGDWVLGSAINWEDLNYIGIDVVKSLILKNQSKFGSDTVRFEFLDAITNDLPSGDLLICKDVLQHLPNSSIINLLTKFGKFRYCILVNDVQSTSGTNNRDTAIGGYRPLDLRCAPFFLKPTAVSYYSSGSTLKQILLIENFSNIKIDQE